MDQDIREGLTELSGILRKAASCIDNEHVTAGDLFILEENLKRAGDALSSYARVQTMRNNR